MEMKEDEIKLMNMNAYEYIVHRRKPIEIKMNESPVGDIGCGSGQNCKLLKGFVICLDIAEKQLKEAKKRGCENLIQADMEFLPFRDSSFKLLMYIASIHQLPSPNNALSEATRVLKKCGKIIITVWLRQIRFLFRKEVIVKSNINGLVVMRYYRLYWPWELKKICEKKGFVTLDYKVYRVRSILPNNAIYIGYKNT
ncbi:Methyltransferase type 11 [Acidianus hospitalis W1]|jgi:ubiquinone/menaquinone biosynthesis C-methylase UbiE|uniref:Methyltransferase type 11 n=1 Tax=Acidianus hospitalis (strain W1) TaxID=933801 RepID=F4B406_ACIHW|nr:Methyltransferase type 11 [Acidianus hospitalis W1]